MFLLRLVKIGPRVLEKRIICKVYENKNDDNNATTNTKKPDTIWLKKAQLSLGLN